MPCDFTYTGHLHRGTIETERRLVVTRCWEEQGEGVDGELLLNGYRVSVWGGEKVLENSRYWQWLNTIIPLKVYILKWLKWHV